MCRALYTPDSEINYIKSIDLLDIKKNLCYNGFIKEKRRLCILWIYTADKGIEIFPGHVVSHTTILITAGRIAMQYVSRVCRDAFL